MLFRSHPGSCGSLSLGALGGRDYFQHLPECSVRDLAEEIHLAFLLTQLRYSEGGAEGTFVLMVEEHHFHMGARLAAAKNSLTNIIKLEQTFPQVRGGGQGRLGGGGTGGSRLLITMFFLMAGEGNGNPLQYSCLENSMDRGAW